jgi:micrococcal nuclease
MPSPSALLLGLVVGVSDGDTLTVLTPEKQQVKVRLAEIDAPEKAQPFGQRAKQYLSALCYDKQAQLRIVDMDRYGRAVARVTCDGTDANASQVKAGMAWVYDKYAKDAALYGLQDEARAARRGLWVDRGPVAPWEFRKHKKAPH